MVINLLHAHPVRASANSDSCCPRPRHRWGHMLCDIKSSRDGFRLALLEGRRRVKEMLFFRNAGLALGAGYILFFCSERLFWSVFKPGDSVSELAVTWLAYSTIAYWFLALIRWFEAESARAVLLAGACYGWMTEGMLVGTLYGTEDSAPFPLSVVCTGLSWHALISVGVGWYAVQKCCRGGRSRFVC